MALAAAFWGYEQTLGRLTDFEPIDVALLQPLNVNDEPDVSFRPEDEIAAERAFGPTEGAKLKLLKMYQVPKAVFSDSPRGRGLGLFIFFKEYTLNHDNDPKLVEFTNVRMIYISGSPSSDGSSDDVYSLESDQAIIRFDRDVECKATTNAQPLAGWVEGNVRLRSNQGTAGRDDDVKVLTARLDYEKLRNIIWAEKLVEVLGEDGMRIAGVGMEIDLTPDKPPTPGTVAAKKKAADVERLRLLDRVDFHLMVEGDSHVRGGLGGASAAAGPTKAATPLAAKPKEKAPLDVRSKGPFNYDMKTMIATFDKAVEVERKNQGDAKCDQLLCERLKLQFVEKPEEKATAVAVRNPSNSAKRSGATEDVAVDGRGVRPGGHRRRHRRFAKVAGDGRPPFPRRRQKTDAHRVGQEDGRPSGQRADRGPLPIGGAGRRRSQWQEWIQRSGGRRAERTL